MPPGLHEDRARLHGLPPALHRGGAQGSYPHLHLVRPQIAWLADMLHDGRRISWARRPASPTSRLSRRVVLQGPAHRLPPRARALPSPARLARRMAAIVTASAPTSIPPRRLQSRATPNRQCRVRRTRTTAIRPGERARLRPADNAKDWVEGEVSFVDAHEITLLRHDPEVGQVAAFPASGYDWRRA